MNKASIRSAPPEMTSRSKQGGFTLIEIAIVLVIIGLLLGGVLKGQELINTARVRALNNTVDGITAAWFSFQDRYRAFPGDYPLAQTNLPAPVVPMVNGDGNGLAGMAGTVVSPVERSQIWVQLQAAGYITGNFNGANVAQSAYNCALITCPDNGFGSGLNMGYGAQNQTQVAAGGFGGGGLPAHELISGQGIPVEVLAELDRKVDDGNAGSGAMQLGGAGTGWTAAQATACQNAANPNLYGVLTPSVNCAAVFRNF
ncbi:MAG TPA: prepilin-type N-terminal cleavage/methylation domain-containing protein [Gammaproteobacteria bacterium]|nr:prepilin-type N-terminal cleavage/methylation domain-containing protein [Gammaproteobacteria bacterium]